MPPSALVFSSVGVEDLYSGASELQAAVYPGRHRALSLPLPKLPHIHSAVCTPVPLPEPLGAESAHSLPKGPKRQRCRRQGHMSSITCLLTLAVVSPPRPACRVQASSGPCREGMRLPGNTHLL